ncbi:hypothetical protein OC187_03575 [Anaplasma capra]|nr:hypothetical protein [Anaplasma capra]
MCASFFISVSAQARTGLIRFSDPQVANGEVGTSDSGQDFFNPKVHFCYRGSCAAASPGKNVNVPGYLDQDIEEIRGYYIAASTGMLPPAIPNSAEYCGSAYFDENSGELCACISSHCYSELYARHDVMSCIHADCTPLRAVGNSGFCNSLSTKRKRVKFVPVSFSAQSYFRPGIRVVSYDYDSKTSVPNAQSLYLDLEAGETKKEFVVALGGSTYVIEVEKKMHEDLICGTYKEGSANVHTDCAPTPFLPKPTVYKARDLYNKVGVRFPGCRDPKNCMFELQVGETRHFPAELSAIIPTLSDDYMIKQYVKCPEGSLFDLVSVNMARAGHLLCKDGSEPKLEYMSGGVGSSNLRCLAIGQHFTPAVGVSRDINIEFGGPRNGKIPQFSMSAFCRECTDHLAHSNTMLRDKNGRIDIGGYALLGAGYIGKRETYGVVVRKQVTDLSISERSLVSDGCPGFPDILLRERQELLDLLIPGAHGIHYLLREDIKKMNVVGNVDGFCPDLDRIPMRYSVPMHKHSKMLNTQAIKVGDPHDQGLCVLVSRGSEVLAAGHLYIGPRGRKEKNKQPKYQYVESGVFKNCRFLSAELFEPGVTGRKATYLVKNLVPQYGLTAVLNLGNVRTGERTMVSLCFGTLPVRDLSDLEGSKDCITLQDSKSIEASYNPHGLNFAHHVGGGSRLDVIYSSTASYTPPPNPPKSGVIRLYCVD